MTTTYRVTADHKFPQYACTDREARIGKDGYHGTYYATISGFGCSKNYRTPKEAITNMLLEHACTNIRITEYRNE